MLELKIPFTKSVILLGGSMNDVQNYASKRHFDCVASKASEKIQYVNNEGK
jgi:hypothetical protein